MMKQEHVIDRIKAIARQESFQSRLEKALELRDMKAARLAEMIDVDRTIISRYLSGKTEPKIETVKKMAIALNVSDDWLNGFDAPMELPLDSEAMKYIEARLREDESLESAFTYIANLKPDEIKAIVGFFKMLDPKE